MLNEIDVGKTLSGINEGATLTRNLGELAGALRPFKPTVKDFRINYLDKNSEIKYLIEAPSGLRRSVRGHKLEIPARTGFRIYEILDLDTGNVLKKYHYYANGAKWVFDLKDFPNSDRFLLTLKGRISQNLLDQIVDVRCAANPSRDEKTDVYWLHSTLKDIPILRKWWDELNVENINLNIRVGVQRCFSTAIPNIIMERLAVRSALMSAIAQGDRNKESRLKAKFRYLERTVKVTPLELFEFLSSLVSGKYFFDYVSTDGRFSLGTIEPVEKYTKIIPEKVQVAVQTDLNFFRPVKDGKLFFKRDKYISDITNSINKLVEKKRPKKKKKVKKKKKGEM